MLQIQAKRDSRTSREGNDSWLYMVLHQERSPASAEGNRIRRKLSQETGLGGQKVLVAGFYHSRAPCTPAVKFSGLRGSIRGQAQYIRAGLPFPRHPRWPGWPVVSRSRLRLLRRQEPAPVQLPSGRGALVCRADVHNASPAKRPSREPQTARRDRALPTQDLPLSSFGSLIGNRSVQSMLLKLRYGMGAIISRRW
jgi:hypothetical protein